MTNEMNSLHDLIFGQNQMIDGCLLEMQKSICLSGSIIAEDSTCNTARLTRQTLCDAIIQKGRDMGLDDEHVKVYPKIFCSETYS